MFQMGDRVQFAPTNTPHNGEINGLLGTVVGFVRPEYATRLEAPDDVVVRWDPGLEFAHASFTLAHAEQNA